MPYSILALKPVKPRFSKSYYVDGILNNNRVVLGQAITLIESNLPTDQLLAGEVLEDILPHTGNSIRVGITGVPGVGKSTFIETLGLHVAQHHHVAVLSIDPSSQVTKGSILGDKTRMEELSRHPKVFIRPTASGNTLGGVANRTREALLLCEAAGYNVIFVETVGVGQSEVTVKNMVDFFLLLMLAGAGDELQGIKKGIMEMADALVITKADGDNIKRAREAQAEYQHALHLFEPAESGWIPQVKLSSALTCDGVPEVWSLIQQYQQQMSISGFLTHNRSRQRITWFHEQFDHLLKQELVSHYHVNVKKLEHDVRENVLSSYAAAHQLLELYYEAIRGKKS